MALHWQIVALYLYFEIGFCFILTLPFISNKRWSSIFKSGFIRKAVDYASTGFNLMLAVLSILFIDAVRETQKYSRADKQLINLQDNLMTKEHVMMNMFRAQRNLYISGFALFLHWLLKRVVDLIMSGATMEAKCEAALKQAQSASTAAQTLMNSRGTGDFSTSSNDKKEKELEATLAELKEKLEDAKKAKKEADAEVEEMKSRSEALKVDYDHVCRELAKAQQGQTVTDKKDD